VFNIVYILAVLLPVATNIKAIVREREEKLREAMLMVGLSDAAIFLSWMFTYTIIYAVIAIFVMLFSLSTLFQFSNPGYSEC
jgi:ATP-binding cassette, subfamily A (ABC1), member 3